MAIHETANFTYQVEWHSVELWTQNVTQHRMTRHRMFSDRRRILSNIEKTQRQTEQMNTGKCRKLSANHVEWYLLTNLESYGRRKF